MSAKNDYISRKLSEVKKMGVRRNTHAPVSTKNPRRPVSHQQAVAIAMNEVRRKGYQVPSKQT